MTSTGTTVSVRKWRSFADATMNISPLTLITGANSSGKTSLLYGVLAPAQSQQFPFNLALNGKFAEMGDFSDAVHRRSSKDSISLTFCWAGTTLETVFSADARSALPQLVSATFADPSSKVSILRKTRGRFEVTIEASPPSEKEAVGTKAFKRFFESISEMNAEFEAQFAQMQSATKRKGKGKRPAIRTNQYDVTVLSQADRSIRLSTSALEHVGVWFTETSQFDLSMAWGRVRGAFNARFGDIGFISSFREAPKRIYFSSGSSERVGRYGENSVQQMSIWQASGAPEFKALLSQLRKLRLLKDVRSRRLTAARLDLLAKPHAGTRPAQILNVGFGVSQFLPILVADLQLPPSATFCVSQPELHLHPSMQAALANHFVARLKENPMRKYVIETHSEYLINRLRLLIANGKLDSSAVALNHVVHTAGKSEVFPITLNRDGSLGGAPKDFFDTYLTDTVAIAMSRS